MVHLLASADKAQIRFVWLPVAVKGPIVRDAGEPDDHESTSSSIHVELADPWVIAMCEAFFGKHEAGCARTRWNALFANNFFKKIDFPASVEPCREHVQLLGGSRSIFFDSDFDRLPCTSRENFRKQAAIVCFVRYPPRRCQNLSGPAASKQRSPRSTRHPECAARHDKYLAFHGHGCDFCLQNVQSVVSHNPCLHSQKPAL